MHGLKHLLFVFILVFIPGIFVVSDMWPVADETVYVRYAYSIHQHEVYGLAIDTSSKPVPSAHVAPAVPLYIAGFMLMNKPFSESIRCFIERKNKQKPCTDGFFAFKIMNLAYLAVCLAVSWYLLLVITGSKSLAYIVVALITLSGAPWYFADHFLTETLYVPLAIIFYLVFALSFYRSDFKGFLGSGILLGLLALIRPSFLYLFIVLFTLLPVILLMMKKSGTPVARMIIKHTFVFLAGFTLVVSPWMIRNYLTLDRATVTVGYGAFALSSRVAYNQMTDREYLAGWIYWLPDFGDSLAEDLFGKENTHRLDFGSPDGFINKNREDIRKEISKATGARLDYHEAGHQVSPVAWLLKEYVVKDLFNHIKVTLLLAWRGLFIEKYFGLTGFLAILWGLAGGLKGELRSYFLLFTFPIIILLFFHASLTASIPRYNLSLLLPMSFCMAVAVQRGFGFLESAMKINRKHS